MQEALERVIAELVLGPELDTADPAAVSDFLCRCGAAGDDAAALADGGLARLGVYRKLVRHTLRDAVWMAIPRVMARLGVVFDETFDRFLAERAPRTRYLRDVTVELLEWSIPQWRRDERVPAYIVDLARHESVQIEIGAMPAERVEVRDAALDPDRGVAFIAASRVLRYAFAVHELADDETDRTLPAERSTTLFVYRNPEHEVRYLELTPLAAAIIERLRGRGASLGDAIRDACTELSHPLDAAVLEGTARVLADLAERGALLGSAT